MSGPVPLPDGRHGLDWAIYCRISGRQGVSTGDGEDDTVSLETQEARCRAMVAALDPTGRVVETLVVREIWSGVELFSRPKLTGTLLPAIRSGRVDAVACFHPWRWARDPDHAGYLYSELDYRDVPLRFVEDDPGDDPKGRLVGFIQHWSGKQDHAVRTEQTHRARAALVEAGHAWATSKPPYGLRWRYATSERPDGRIVQRKIGWSEEPAEAAVLRELSRRVLAGASQRGLALDLTERGIPSPTGKPGWSDSTVRYLLRQRLYTGEAYGLRHVRDKAAPRIGTRGKSAGRKRYRDVVRPEEEWVRLPDGYAPCLIEPEVFAAVQAALAGRRRGGSAPAATAEQTLMGGGRARCGECGNTLSRLGSTRRVLICSGRAMRKCGSRPSIRMALLDDAVRRLAYRIYEHPEVIVERAEAHRAADPTEADLAMVDRTLAELARQEQGLLLVAGQVTNAAAAAALGGQLERLAERRAGAERDRADLLARRAGWREARAYLDGFLRQAQRVRRHLDGASHAQWQRAVDLLGIEATVYPASASVRFVLTTELDGLLGPRALAGLEADGLLAGADGRVCVMRSGAASTAHQPRLTLAWPAPDVLAFPPPPRPSAAPPRRAAG